MSINPSLQNIISFIIALIPKTLSHLTGALSKSLCIFWTILSFRLLFRSTWFDDVRWRIKNRIYANYLAVPTQSVARGQRRTSLVPFRGAMRTDSVDALLCTIGANDVTPLDKHAASVARCERPARPL